MTRIPFKVRFWKRKLEAERSALSISRTLASRVFYAGCFFYASFLAHGYFVYDNTASPPLSSSERSESRGSEERSGVPDQPLERGLTQPLLDAVLGRRS